MRSGRSIIYNTMWKVYLWIKKSVDWFTDFYLIHIRFPMYVKSIPHKVSQVRNKSIIKVAFIVSDLAEWKTEMLYVRMLNHPRFSPVVLVIQGLGLSEVRKQEVEEYCKKQCYKYELLRGKETIWGKIHPDILFYQKPYCYGHVLNRYGFHKNLQSLLCYVDYGFFTENNARLINTELHNIVWQLYFENTTTFKERSELMSNHGVNGVVVGSPISELFMSKKLPNPWKYQDKSKKRIIWAPHHSIPELNLLFRYSTFLNYYDFMLKLADEYKDTIQIAFKPHPLLYARLMKVWPESRVKAYYHEWELRENTQLELGDYVGLMVHSDAMIHDCVSFRVEYHYTQKPVMFLEDETALAPDTNTVGRLAYDLHYKGHSEQDILSFIDHVVGGIDPLKEDRIAFYKQYLLPPNSKTVSENIINSILGQN